MTARVCLYVDETMTDPEGHYVPAIVTENEPGYTPSDYRFGPDIETAKLEVKSMNQTLGHTPHDVLAIVFSSMRAQGIPEEDSDVLREP